MSENKIIFLHQACWDVNTRHWLPDPVMVCLYSSTSLFCTAGTLILIMLSLFGVTWRWGFELKLATATSCCGTNESCIAWYVCVCGRDSGFSCLGTSGSGFSNPALIFQETFWRDFWKRDCFLPMFYEFVSHGFIASQNTDHVQLRCQYLPSIELNKNLEHMLLKFRHQTSAHLRNAFVHFTTFCRALISINHHNTPSFLWLTTDWLFKSDGFVSLSSELCELNLH